MSPVRRLQECGGYTAAMRRMPAQTALIFSVIAALACVILAVWLMVNHTFWALLPTALAVWFAVDSWRAWGWTKGDDGK